MDRRTISGFVYMNRVRPTCHLLSNPFLKTADVDDFRIPGLTTERLKPTEDATLPERFSIGLVKSTKRRCQI